MRKRAENPLFLFACGGVLLWPKNKQHWVCHLGFSDGLLTDAMPCRYASSAGRKRMVKSKESRLNHELKSQIEKF